MRSKSPMKRSPLARNASLVQPLEPRRLFAATLDVTNGVLTYTGSDAENALTVRHNGLDHVLHETGEGIDLSPDAVAAGARFIGDAANGLVYIPHDAVSRILINTKGGNDDVVVSQIKSFLSVETSSGLQDRITLGAFSSTNALDGDILLTDSGGMALVTVNDTQSPSKTVNINNNIITGLTPNGHTVRLDYGIESMTMNQAYAATTNVNITGTPLRYLAINGTTTNGGVSPDAVNVIATPEHLNTVIDLGRGVPDTITIGNGTTSNILGTLVVSDSGGSGNLVIDDSTSGVARNIAVGGGFVTGATANAINFGGGITDLTVNLSGAANKVTFNSGSTDLESAVFNGGNGGDTFLVTPSPDTAVTVNGGSPSSPTATPDVLLVKLDGVSGASHTLGAAGSGTWTFADRQTITFTGVDGYDAATLRAMVGATNLSKGSKTSLLAKLNLDGGASDAEKLGSFISKVDGLLQAGELTAADAAALTQAANVLLQASQY